MSPRFKFGEGFSVPQEREFQLMGSWMPVTPEKSISTTNPIQVDRYGNPLGRENWQEQPGFSGGHMQQTPDYNRAVPNLNLIGQADQNEGYYGNSIAADNRNRMINHIAASLYNGNAVSNNNQSVNFPAMKNASVLVSANGTHGSSMSMPNGPPIMNLHSQVGNWREVNSLDPRESNLSNLLPQRELNSRNLLPQMEFYPANCLLPGESHSNNFLQQRESNLSHLFQQSESNLDGLCLQRQYSSHSLQQRGSNPNHLLQQRESSHSLQQRGSNPNHLLQQRESNSSHLLQQREYNPSHLLQQKESNPSHLMQQQESNPSHLMQQRESLSHLLLQRESNLSHLLLQRESNLSDSWLHGQNHCSGSNLSSNSGSFHQIPQYEFPVPYQPQSDYRLHSPPRSEADAASSVTTTFPFPPVTPDQSKKLESNNFLTTANFFVDESSIQENDKQEYFVVSTGNEAIQHNNDELLQNVVDLSSVVNSSQLEEKRDSDNGTDQGIDLNKTPQLKPPRRRKHRPKVIIEGKPKRTRKTATPKTTKTEENPGGKRKYVRKKQLKDSETEQAPNLRETADPSTGPVARSCRRELSFDLEKLRDESQIQDIGQQEETQQRYKRAFNLNLDSQATDLDSGINNSEYRTEATVLIGQQNGSPTDTLQPRTVSNHNCSINQIPGDNISVPEKQAVAASVPPRKDLHMENLNVIARNAEIRIGDPSQKNSTKGYIPIQQHTYAKVIGPTNFQANNGLENLERTRQMPAQSIPQSTPNILSISKEARGSKREYYHATEQTHPCAENQMGSSFLCQNVFQTDEFQRIGAGCSETHKKRKIENGLHANINGRLSGVAAVQDGSILNGNRSALHANYHMLNSQLGSNNIARRENSGFNNVVSDQYAQSMDSAQYVSFVQRSLAEKMGGTTRLTPVHNFVPLFASQKCNLIPPTPPIKSPAPGGRLVPKSFGNNISSKQNVKSTLAKSVSSGMDQVLPEQRVTLYDHLRFSAKTRGTRGPPLKQIRPISMDEIIQRFKGLNLNGRAGQAQEQEQNAIVPYKQDGTVVPYEGFDFLKKRKPRPKVDLDPETNRIWKLLMGKEGEGLEGTDKDKEKWWEEERRVFQGRADSFIARMHLVQGDRRFSKWKGSVVDSVIGVFLTQNVSDHLSSSAFMSLAARFPVKSNNRMCNMDGTNVLVEEPEVCVSSPNNAIQWNEQLLKNPLHSQSNTTAPHEPIQHQRQSETSRIERTSLPEVHSHSLEEEVLSSQDSFTSSIFQGNGGIRSSSGSNSEAEDPTYGCMPNQDSGSKNSLQMQSADLYQEFYNCLNESSLFEEGHGHRHKLSENTEHGQQKSSPLTFTQLLNFNNPQNQAPLVPSSNYKPNKTSYLELLEGEGSDIYSGDCTSFFPSTASEFPKARDENYKSRRVGQQAKFVGESTVQQNGLLMSEKMPTQDPYALSSKHSRQEPNGSQQGSHGRCNKTCSDNHLHVREKSFQFESRSLAEPVNLVEAPAKAQNKILPHVPNVPELAKRTFDVEERVTVVNKQIHLENKLIEPNSGGQVLSAHKSYDEATPNISKSKKGKADNEKKNAVDWDYLRKQVLGNGRKTERTKETMDSLDYEALRTAKVKDISDAIKERGMNNMLAERIQDFLNRLVRDHGSIDLEWLRDVPADKSKDYLLSVRGLGLKSVECVRLLTLHHLAFPVDTNVGRIAVRLGWVPLQPLPESLQLHLLELYPILESIQKYLWPRLCKLDQRTLYELHYQLITFGKVFCTKSKPNCNACPMRGECRHFASAFASARLALPGPEEKGIVRSTVPITPERNPEVVINPMPLPAPEKNSLQVGCEVSKCVPIIEEPATPEQQCTEVSESDFEDTFGEDPDEIPTIKLNIEEFTVNLQNYMQDNMELQEVDMSKALVALSSEVASLPTPKLKNVSRLRTEHQVYQLPDSHPLLNGMERREPDDPSPYLLAIWTPGETANSIQPPEKRCESQESGRLCTDATCFSCNSERETNSQTVRGTLLIPCRTAMRGSFPLNGTYFQVNEVFADHASSLNPIDVPREWIWNLPRRIVYFGTSVSTIFKGLSTEGIQFCFWKGFVCVRGFDQTLRAPRPLMARLHFPASKLAKTKNENK